MQKILLSMTLTSFLFASEVVVPDDYFISKDENLTYIYAKEYEKLLPDIKQYQEEIIDGYEKEYGFDLDEKLYVGLASKNNAIANGFSTQFPFNSQLFYGAGAGAIDYFCFSSWLKTLLIHETAHNFQLNPKENDLSRISHKVLGNIPFAMVGILPMFPVPNVTESSFILEGNAVMNESRYGNGGRLFSGYALAEVVSLAKAGKITPELMYNQTLSFPYGEKFYLVGGFFQQFLLQRYGIEKVNGYFKRYASQPFPFFTNWMFKAQYGKNFETLLDEFVEELLVEHKDFTMTKGKILAQSQVFVPLNRDEHHIYTLVNNKKSASKILKIEKESKRISYEEGSWAIGEVFKHKGEYYTQTSAKSSPVKVSMGLFDKDRYLLNGTDFKVVQGYTSRGEMVYFDVLKSLETPQVFVNGVFYTESHSSVYVDKNDLYYFKQEGEKRILYKNREALFDYQGHYGFVSDVDALGNIYFIAPSEHGSSVYCLSHGEVKRVVEGDDVIDFKYLNSKESVVATIGEQGYSYQHIELDSSRVGFSRPHEFKIKNSGRLKPILEVSKFKEEKKTLKSLTDYNALTALNYSSLDQSMVYTQENGISLKVQANFSDPLLQNRLSAQLSLQEEYNVAGITYDNSANILEFGGAVYTVAKNDKFENEDIGNYGYEASLHLPFLAQGYWKAFTTLAYSKPYDSIYREPLTLSLDIQNKKQFGLSKYANSLNSLSLFASSDRDTKVVGASYEWMHDFPWQSYVGAKGAYLMSDTLNIGKEKGVELSDTLTSLQLDKATLNIPTLEKTTYAKEVKMAEVSLTKVFDFSLYNYSFPLSLQRESVYLKQRLYDIDLGAKMTQQYNESVVGFEADLLFFHKASIPLGIEYLYNPDVHDKSQVRVVFSSEF